MLDPKDLTDRDPQVAGILSTVATYDENSHGHTVHILCGLVPDLTVEQADIAIDQISDLLDAAERLYEEAGRRDWAEMERDEWVGHAKDVARATVQGAGQPLVRSCGDDDRHTPHGWLDDTDRGLVERWCVGQIRMLAAS